MAYDLNLAERIRAEMTHVPFVEKKMFGGVGFLLNGNMACGVNRDNLIVRIDPAKQEMLLRKQDVRVFDLTGRPMRGWLLVTPEGCETRQQLRAWVREGIAFASTLPAK